MLAAGTIDEEIYNIIERKRSVVYAAIEGGEVEETKVAEELIKLFTERALGD